MSLVLVRRTALCWIFVTPGKLKHNYILALKFRYWQNVIKAVGCFFLIALILPTVKLLQNTKFQFHPKFVHVLVNMPRPVGLYRFRCSFHFVLISCNIIMFLKNIFVGFTQKCLSTNSVWLYFTQQMFCFRFPLLSLACTRITNRQRLLTFYCL